MPSLDCQNFAAHTHEWARPTKPEFTQKGRFSRGKLETSVRASGHLASAAFLSVE